MRLKSILVTTLLTVAVAGSALAAFPGDDDKEAADIFSAIQDIRYTVEADPDFRTYKNVVFKANVALIKYDEKHAYSSINGKLLDQMMKPYKDALAVWTYAIENRTSFYPDYTHKLASEYNIPILFTIDGADALDTGAALKAMFDYAKDIENTYNT